MVASIADYRPLLYWVETREATRINKEWNIRPYTEDKIIAEYRFCNVRREDDRVTLWVKENIRERFADHPHLWFMLCIARQINWPDTIADLLQFHAFPNDDRFIPDLITGVLNRRKANGLKIYTGAYMISAPHEKGADKQKYIAEHVLGNLWENRINFPLNSTLELTHKWLHSFDGWGPFMAYQVIVDMRFTKILNNASDVHTWAAAGPGTIRGLNRIHGRDKEFNLSQAQALIELQQTFEFLKSNCKVKMDFSDVPNAYCETDKYMRVWYGEGRPRAKYVIGRGY